MENVKEVKQEKYTLQRKGKSPLKFKGYLLGERTTFKSGIQKDGWYTYGLYLYRTRYGYALHEIYKTVVPEDKNFERAYIRGSIPGLRMELKNIKMPDLAKELIDEVDNVKTWMFVLNKEL